MPRKPIPAAPSTTLIRPDDFAVGEAGHADGAAREQRYQRLALKMAAYQQGTGPAPGIAEFEQWKEDVAFSLAMRRLLAGAPEA